VYPQTETVASLTYKQQKNHSEIFLFLLQRFLYDHWTFFRLISKMFCNFLLQLNMAKHKLFFSALGPEIGEQIKLMKNKIRFDLKLSKCDSDARI